MCVHARLRARDAGRNHLQTQPNNNLFAKCPAYPLKRRGLTDAQHMHTTIQVPSPLTPNPQSTTINPEHALSPPPDLLLRGLPPEISGGSRDGAPTIIISTSSPSNLAEPLVATVPLRAATSPDPLLITSPGPVRRSSLASQDHFLPVASIAGQSSEK